MICFQVEVNGQQACAAGIGTVGSLGVHLTWLKPNPLDATQRGGEQMTLTVSGFMQAQGQTEWLMSRWLDQPIKPGDVILIRVVDQPNSCDPPAKQGQIGNLFRPDPSQLLDQVQKAYADLREEVENRQPGDNYSI